MVLATVLIAVAHCLAVINQGTLISSTLVTRTPNPGPALPLSGEDVERIRGWRSPAGNLQVAGLPGWGAGGQKERSWREKGPAHPQDGRSSCARSRLEPLQVSTRTHPRTRGGRSEP